MATHLGEYESGMRVRVTQQIPHGKQTWTNTVEGVVVRFGQQKTGSWFAHSKDHKLWLDRVQLKKDDGEVAFCNLDQNSRVEIIDN